MGPVLTTTLTVEQVNACSPDAIDGVAAAWEKLSTAMDGDSARVERDVLAPLRNAWISKDGTSAVRLIGFVAAQLDGVRNEAGGLASILRAAAIDLREAKSMLTLAETDLSTNNMKRGPDGIVSLISGTPDANTDAVAKIIENRFNTALQLATDADALAAATMKRNVDFLTGNAKNDFNAWSLGGDARADSLRVSGLMEKLAHDGELSEEDMALLKLLLQDNQGDKSFQLQMLLDAGPQTLLQAASATNDPQAGIDPGNAQMVQTTLRDALIASSGELAKNPQWMQQLKDAGRTKNTSSSNKYGGAKTPWGYQDLDLLLRQGQYDTSFLAQIGDDLLEFDVTQGKGLLWETRGYAENDPIAGFMTTLKNNPAATTALFTGPQGREHVSQVINHQYSGQPHHLAPFGEAVKAVTTFPPGTNPGTPTTKAMAEVLGNVVNALGTEGVPQALEKSGELRASVAEMLKNNAASMHLALTQAPASKDLRSIPAEEVAAISNDAMKRVLADYAKTDPAAFEAFKKAEETYAYLGLDYMMEKYADNQTLRHNFVQDFSRDVGQVFGAFDAAAAEQIRKDGGQTKQSETDSIAHQQRIAAAAITASVGALHTVDKVLGAGPGANQHPIFQGLTTGGGAGINFLVAEVLASNTPKDPSAKPISEIYRDGEVRVELMMQDWQNQNPAYNGGSLPGEARAGYGTQIDPERQPQ